jgi:hypothetical protein
MFATRPHIGPYLGAQPQVGPQALGQQMSPMLQQLMQNPAFLARLQQLQGTGLGGVPIQQSPYGLGRFGTQPIASGAYSLR